MNLFTASELNSTILKKIWVLCMSSTKSTMKLRAFQRAMRLISMAQGSIVVDVESFVENASMKLPLPSFVATKVILNFVCNWSSSIFIRLTSQLF